MREALTGALDGIQRFALEVPRSRLLVWAGAAGLVLAAFSPWLSLPLSGRVPGLACPIAGAALAARGQGQRLELASWGSLCLVLAVLVIGLEWRRRDRAAFRAGLAAMAIAPLFLLALVFREPELLARAVAEAGERTAIASFSARYLEGSAGALARSSSPPANDGIADRLVTALDHTSFTAVAMGSRIALLAGLLVVAGSLAAGRRRKTFAWAGDAVFGLALVTLAASAMGHAPVRAEVIARRAARAASEGFPELALRGFAEASALDPVLAGNAAFVGRLGAAAARAGLGESAAAALRAGASEAAAGDDRGALDAYRSALELEPGMAVARRAAAESLARIGLERFADGHPDAAIRSFREGLRLDPERLDLRFYLAHALFLLGEESSDLAIAENLALLRQVRDRLVRADLYVNLGDCYQRRRDLVRARAMYRQSLRSYRLVKKVINFNAVAGLEGT